MCSRRPTCAFEVLARPRFFPSQKVAARKRSQVVQAEIAALAAEHRRALATFAQERAAIRVELARELSLNDAVEMDAALTAAIQEALQAENDGPYRAYYAAVFEPGLSPEQRRLLLDSAMDQLGQPLPSGEYQPQL